MVSRNAFTCQLILPANSPPLKPTYSLSSFKFRDEDFDLKDPSMFSFASPSGGTNDCVATIGLELYCHFEVHLESDEDISLDLENFFNRQLESVGWRAEAYFRKCLQDGGRAYKIVFYGNRQAITKEAAEEVRLRLISELGENGFPYIARGAWTISNPCPASMLTKYLKFVVTESEGKLIEQLVKESNNLQHL
jgi:hypothetical protein